MDDFDESPLDLDLDGDGDDAMEMCLFFDEEGKRGRGKEPTGKGGCLTINP